MGWDGIVRRRPPGGGWGGLHGIMSKREGIGGRHIRNLYNEVRGGLCCCKNFFNGFVGYNRSSGWMGWVIRDRLE